MARKQLSATLKDISAAAKEQRWKSGRRGEIGGGDRDVKESEYGASCDGSKSSGTETGDAQVAE